MKRLNFAAVFAALALSCAPAYAQRIVVPPAPASGSIANRDNPGEEFLGGTIDLTSVAASGSTNTKGSCVTLGTASGALWKGLYLLIGNTSTTAANYAFDVSVDGGTSYPIQNVVISAGGSSLAYYLYWPQNIQTSTTANAVCARVQSSTASATLRFGVIGLLDDDSQARPLWDNSVNENFNSGTTTVDDADITVGTGSGAYVVLDSSLSQNCGAILLTSGSFSATSSETGVFTITQDANGGAAGSGTVIAKRPFYRSASAGATIRQYLAPIYRSFTAGQQISAKADSTAGAGTARLGVHCFY